MAGDENLSNHFISLANDSGVDTPLRKFTLIRHPDEIAELA